MPHRFGSRFHPATISAGALAAVTAAPAFAIDVSGVVSAIDALVAPVGLIGAAILLVLVAIKGFKLVRRAM